MKKSTDELMNILRNKRSVDEYFAENDNEIFFGTLSEQVNFYIARKGLTKAEVVRRSGLNRGYCYEILSGKKTKNISRDKVILLCFGLELSVDEAQQLLKKCGYAPLYARDTRDSIIIFCIENSISVINTNIKLGDYNLEPLE